MEELPSTQAFAELWPLGVYLLCVLLLVVLMLGISWLLNTPPRDSAARNEPYESGIVALGFGRFKLTVHFYVVAMLFVLFDLEVVYILAWAIAWDSVGWAGYWGLLVFIGILTVGLAYEWRMGALDWHPKLRQAPAVRHPIEITAPNRSEQSGTRPRPSRGGDSPYARNAGGTA